MNIKLRNSHTDYLCNNATKRYIGLGEHCSVPRFRCCASGASLIAFDYYIWKHLIKEKIWKRLKIKTA